MGDSPGGAPAPRPVSEDGDSIGTRRPVNSRNSWRTPTVLDCQCQLIFYSIFRRKYFTDKVTFFLEVLKKFFVNGVKNSEYIFKYLFVIFCAFLGEVNSEGDPKVKTPWQVISFIV